MRKNLILLFLSVFFMAHISAQNKIMVEGTVIDETQEPLIGVSVVVKGTTIGGVTDFDGNYSLSDIADDATLVFSMMGFEIQEVNVKGKNLINVTLKEDLKALDEIIVIGYGTAKKSDLTSSISSVKGEDLRKLSVGNAANALQGKAAGVQVTSSGGPGAVPRVIIRGVTTINGTDPLYVVDGVPIDGNINFLNQNDIENMEVLKDASASAIYGTRGSNGVILVTTKKGRKGKTLFQFNSSVGFQHINKVDMADAGTYERFFKERYTNDNQKPVWNPISGENLTKADGTDWWDQTVNDYSLQQSYNIGFQGGNDNIIFSGSVGYFDEKSQFDVGRWQRITARFNTEYSFSSDLKLGVDFNPKFEKWDDTPGIFSAIIKMDPTTPVYKAESEWTSNPFNNYQRSYNNQEWNPVASVARQNNQSQEYGLLMNPYISYSPIESLTFRTQMGINTRFRLSDNFSPKFSIDELEQTTLNKAERASNSWIDLSWTNTINYNTTINNKHNLNTMLGFSMEDYSNYWLTGSREAIPSNLPVLQYPSAGTMNPQAAGTDYTYTLMSYLGRIMYNYDSKYYLTASLRVDGSSKFPEGEKYATFPSASASWRLTSEEFMSDQDLFDDLKIRAGWGKVGNQNIPAGAYLNLIGASDYVFNGERLVGTSISQVGNQLLKWETVEDYNIGLDMTLMNSRLNVTADYYQKKSKDMLIEKNNLLVLGYPMWDGRMWTNIGSMKATGWELSANWRDNFQDGMYEVGVNFSGTKNKALKFSDGAPLYGGGFFNDYITKNEEGKEISRFYGYIADGVFQNWAEVYAHSDDNGNILQRDAQPGDIRFKDLNDDGSINEDDKTYIGNAFPKVTMGLNFSVTYKNFDLISNFYGSFGNDIYNSGKSDLYSGAAGTNIYQDAYDKAWRGEGTSNEYPRLSVNDANLNYRRVSSFFVEDGSYLRLKLLQLGYTFSKDMTKFGELRLSVSAQNLFTITNYSGMDPERAALGGVLASGIDNFGYPNPQTFLFGVHINF